MPLNRIFATTSAPASQTPASRDISTSQDSWPQPSSPNYADSRTTTSPPTVFGFTEDLQAFQDAFDTSEDEANFLRSLQYDSVPNGYSALEGDADLPLPPQHGSTPLGSRHMEDGFQSRPDATALDNLPSPQLPSNRYYAVDNITFPQPGYPRDIGTNPESPLATFAKEQTYTYDYPGCTSRFGSMTDPKLHRRLHQEADRGSGPGSGSAGEGITLSPNSQQGQMCNRINPKTGKPCNIVFSRSSHLNRHVYSIHNQQEIRCEVCRSIFRRHDSLLRHNRTFHAPG